MNARTPTVDFAFPHAWQAEILLARPAILPARHFVYPASADEVERGALEVLVRPAGQTRNLFWPPAPSASTIRPCLPASGPRLILLRFALSPAVMPT